MSDSPLDAVMHKKAKGLHKAGAMDIKTMREFESLCLPKVKEYNVTRIKRLHIKNKASQSVFAAYLNTSPSTVQRQETGQKWFLG